MQPTTEAARLCLQAPKLMIICYYSLVEWSVISYKGNDTQISFYIYKVFHKVSKIARRCTIGVLKYVNTSYKQVKLNDSIIKSLYPSIYYRK
jgi:hypothetical protein